MRIGELAHGAGVSVETVRFYEREGLLPAPPRRGSGYREYPPDTLARLRFIRHAKELGFSLPEIQELLSLRSTEAPCCEVQRRVDGDPIDDATVVWRGTQFEPVGELLIARQVFVTS